MNDRVQYTEAELAEAGFSPDAKPKEGATAAPRMSNYDYIAQELRVKENTQRLSLALGHNGKTERGKTEAFKYISSVLQEIKKTEGDEKKDLTICSVDTHHQRND